MSQLSFCVKIHAHYKTNCDELFEEMFEIARRLNTDVSGAHSYQNLLVSPNGYATVEVPWGEPRFQFYRRRTETVTGGLGQPTQRVVWERREEKEEKDADNA